ncbi:MAG: hypothetical protein M1819_006879 [Sarea resinae]|nr:MAG: hypothetical protein M1819_006879 [Sarea resinae]
MDADTAFRESLFDALADDEGAAFWEGIYGQPIHTYPSTRPSGGGGRDGDGGPRGELEQMTDEEYTSYVRARMYEKTHQHILEERAAREEARARQREARKTTEKMEREREAWQGMVEGSLRRGEERRLRKKWKEIWSAYLSAWEDGREQETQESKATSTSTKTTSTNGDDDIDVKDKIPHWPVQSGRRRDVTHETVEEFLRHAPSEEASSLKNNNTTTPTPSSLARVLKAERIRWHPDKIQQRFGGRENLSEPLMKSVTAVFQVVDRLWGELRAKEGAGRGE